MSNQDRPQNPDRDAKFNPRQTDVKPGREPLPVEKNPTQSKNPDRSGKRDDAAK
jgi:hypothetical protein